jgi:hypothetical protein
VVLVNIIMTLTSFDFLSWCFAEDIFAHFLAVQNIGAVARTCSVIDYREAMCYRYVM